MKARTRIPASWLLTSLLVAGCSSGSAFSDGSGGNAGTANSGEVPLDQVPAQYAQALCDAYEDCMGPLLELFLPGEDCDTLNGARIEDGFGRFEGAIEEGRILYDGSKVTACVEEVRATSCEGLLERESETCEAAVQGTISLGEECSANEECVGSAYCNFAAACPGVCTALEPAGSDCSASNQCQSGLECSADSQTCVAPAGPGDLCDEAGEPACAPGFFCAGADGDNDQPGNCRTYEEVFRVAVGQPCNFQEGELCQTNLVCEIQAVDAMGMITSSCEAKVGMGQPCHLSIPSQCPVGAYCTATLAMLEGTCTALPAEGEPCASVVFGQACAPHMRCDGGTCRPLAELGESCTDNAVCYSERCVGGTCVSQNACE